jgi:hypothetical protein
VPPLAGVQVEGYRELMRSFALISDELKLGLRYKLAEAASPAGARAAQYAYDRIRNMGERWSRMKIGVSATAVYLAPASRRRRGSPRPNLGPLLLKESMLPAATEQMPVVRENLDAWLTELGEGQGF